MNCPKCGGKTSVIDSRPSAEGSVIRRRRSCDACQDRFTTFEVYLPATQIDFYERALPKLQQSLVQIEGSLALAKVSSETIVKVNEIIR